MYKLGWRLLVGLDKENVSLKPTSSMDKTSLRPCGPYDLALPNWTHVSAALVYGKPRTFMRPVTKTTCVTMRLEYVYSNSINHHIWEGPTTVCMCVCMNVCEHS